MKGVILAGGLGSRLAPMTRVTNKHLLPVYDRPMVYYPIECLVGAGIDEVLIVTGEQNAGDFVKLLEDGSQLGLKHLSYAFQRGEGGIADALKLAERFARGQCVCVILGDNIVEKSIAHAAAAFRGQDEGAKVLLKEVHDPERFGVPRFADPSDPTSKIIEIIEKPAAPPSSYAVTGLYFYPPDVFSICQSLKPSARGELEISDVNNEYVRRGTMTHSVLDGWWTDAGTIQSLHHATNLVAEGGANNA